MCSFLFSDVCVCRMLFENDSGDADGIRAYCSHCGNTLTKVAVSRCRPVGVEAVPLDRSDTEVVFKVKSDTDDPLSRERFSEGPPAPPDDTY